MPVANLQQHTAPEGFPGMSNMGNGQIDQMSSMIKTPHGRQMMKTMYKEKFGMEMNDSQLDMMCGMMTPEMMKTGMNMQQKMKDEGVDLNNFSEVQKAAGMMNGMEGMPLMPPNMMNPMAQANGDPQQQMQMPQMPPMGANGMPDMSQMDMSNMGNGMEGLLQNPGMIDSMLEMIKTNPAMLRGMCGSLGDDHPATKWLQGCSD